MQLCKEHSCPGYSWEGVAIFMILLNAIQLCRRSLNAFMEWWCIQMECCIGHSAASLWWPPLWHYKSNHENFFKSLNSPTGWTSRELAILTENFPNRQLPTSLNVTFRTDFGFASFLDRFRRFFLHQMFLFLKNSLREWEYRKISKVKVHSRHTLM